MKSKVFFILIFFGALLLLGKFLDFKAYPVSSNIGVIDMQKSLASHPGMQKAIETLNKFREERQKDIDAKTKGKQLTEEEKAKIAELAQKYEREIAEEDNRLTLRLVEDIKEATKKVSLSKNLTVVLEKGSVIYGGVDITNSVIKELQGK